MDSEVSKAAMAVFLRQRFLSAVTYCRTNIRAVVLAAALVAIITELGGIWSEVHQMRREQVKNATYALSKERRDALRGTAARRRLESTAYVDGEVSIEGNVQLEEPVEVEIDR
jgi:hypothetical protein